VPRPALVDAIKRRIYRNVDAVLVPAPSHSTSYQNWGMSERRIFFGVDVVDNAFFADRADDSRRAGHADLARAGLDLPGDYFLGVGRLVPKKNWPPLLDAYEGYRRGNPADPWGLVLVGDGPLRAELEARAQSLPDVRILHFTAPAELVILYAWASALVLPSFHGETWGLVVNEAMACGLPVLISEECGCAESLVEAGANGWTFSPHDVEALSALMNRLASLPLSERAELGRRSREIVATWSLDRFVEGACAAITTCQQERRGFASPLDRLLLHLWRGRYRPT
jgi:glycosyltransferase involved in cell wall biosynthesis